MSFANYISNLLGEGRSLPNSFTIALGKKIKQAREELNLSQGELAARSYFTQSAISKIESGVQSVSAEGILYLSYALNKPIIYLFPVQFIEDPEESKFSLNELDLIVDFRKLSSSEQKSLIIQIKALASSTSK